ncbi:LuxR C-terminal-related transcriptional regulator [Actinomadura rubrisoli]|uniref:Response regulator transcription factor n=1 Tax=Actinomadura rubrisoli TaxID=2530368 RepID=A0A4R5CA51_9ACTN|nr:response regulator transcription factor [Actinomadura rubrisoli]TDD96791.1 response regulator transcription factor [Actinomadura rubrisoli]
MDQIRVLICDHQPLFRSGVRAMLERDPGIQVLAEVSGREVVSSARRTRPDVVVTDIDLPLERGLDVVRRLARPDEGRPVPVLVLTMLLEDRCVFPALRAGACGFLLKSGSLEELYAGVRAVADGGAVLAPAVARRLLDKVIAHLPNNMENGQRLVDRLTPREREVLDRVARGESNRRIARDLNLSNATVRSHVHHVLTKLGVEDRAQAVAFVYQAGLLSSVNGRGLESCGLR